MKEEYKKYLKSKDWQLKRKSKFESVKIIRCQICGRQDNFQIHHLVYKNLIDVGNRDLIILCEPCHKYVHHLLKHGSVKFKKEYYHYKKAKFRLRAIRKELKRIDCKVY